MIERADNMRKSKILILALCFLIVVLSACSALAENDIGADTELNSYSGADALTEQGGNIASALAEERTREKEVVVMDEMLSWGYYSSYKEALNRADLVVHGKVKNIGTGYKIESETQVTESRVSTHTSYFTPIEIEITELLKGDYNSPTVTFQALGAEIDNVIYDYRATVTLDIKEGDEILVFLRIRKPEIGYESISPGCVIIEDEKGNAVQNIRGESTSNSIENMVSSIEYEKARMEKEK